jgi:hypothetical protein
MKMCEECLNNNVKEFELVFPLLSDLITLNCFLYLKKN